MNPSRSVSVDDDAFADSSSCGAALLLLQVSRIANNEVHWISPNPGKRQLISLSRRPRLLPSLPSMKSSDSSSMGEEEDDDDDDDDEDLDADHIGGTIGVAKNSSGGTYEAASDAPQEKLFQARCRTVSLCSIDLPDRPCPSSAVAPAGAAASAQASMRRIQPHPQPPPIMRPIAPPPTLLGSEVMHTIQAATMAANAAAAASASKVAAPFAMGTGNLSLKVTGRDYTITTMATPAITTRTESAAMTPTTVTPASSPRAVVKKQFVGTSLKPSVSGSSSVSSQSGEATSNSNASVCDDGSASADVGAAGAATGGTAVPVVKAVLRKKFSWKSFPELEAYLIEHRPRYLQFSSQLNYTAEQKRYNNSLTQGLLDLAAESGYIFEGFTFAAVRDRIRCYYKSYVQAVKKKKRKKRR